LKRKKPQKQKTTEKQLRLSEISCEWLKGQRGRG
jgi:hypothetical protein